MIHAHGIYYCLLESRSEYGLSQLYGFGHRCDRIDITLILKFKRYRVNKLILHISILHC